MNLLSRLPRFLFLAALLGCSAPVGHAADPTPAMNPTPAAPEIRTPPAPPAPRINGPRVYGARPGRPFFYHLPVTGERPMRFGANGLPAGLSMDPETGNVTGATDARGTHPVEFTAANGRGIATATINVTIGDTIALTPPMGWNSWNHFAGKVTEKNVRDSADAFVSSGLIDHGWTYINIDDCWQGERDPAGNIQGNAKFPDLKALGDYIHGKGLKFGVYSSPGPKTCAGFAGSYQHEDQDARTYADWGVDYVKYDLCSYYSTIAGREHEYINGQLSPELRPGYASLLKEKDDLGRNHQRTVEQESRLKAANQDLEKIIASVDPAARKAFERAQHRIPYQVFGESLGKVNRDIVYSLCQYGMTDTWEWAPSVGGNSWRTTGDISSNWKSMTNIGFSQDRLAKFAGPGHWNDPDMLEVGNAGLTPDECYTHMTLWCMLSAPLLIGCDLSKMDPFTVSLFSNDEVLAVDQDPLGKQGYRLKEEAATEVWVKPLAGGDIAIALFNRGDSPANVTVDTAAARGLSGDFTEFASPHLRVIDLWRQKIVGPVKANRMITLPVAAHGAELLRVSIPESIF